MKKQFLCKCYIGQQERFALQAITWTMLLCHDGYKKTQATVKMLISRRFLAVHEVKNN